MLSSKYQFRVQTHYSPKGVLHAKGYPGTCMTLTYANSGPAPAKQSSARFEVMEVMMRVNVAGLEELEHFLVVGIRSLKDLLLNNKPHLRLTPSQLGLPFSLLCPSNVFNDMSLPTAFPSWVTEKQSDQTGSARLGSKSPRTAASDQRHSRQFCRSWYYLDAASDGDEG